MTMSEVVHVFCGGLIRLSQGPISSFNLLISLNWKWVAAFASTHFFCRYPFHFYRRGFPVKDNL